MKRFTLLLMLALAGSTLFIHQIRQARQNRSRLAELEEKLRQSEAETARQEIQNNHLQTRLQETRSQFTAKAVETEDLKQTLAKAAAAPKVAEPNPGAKLLQDPNMRAMMKKEYLHAAERTVDQVLNTNLIQQLRLSDEQTAFLKDLLKKKGATGVEMVLALMAGEDETRMAELGKTMKQEKESIEAQIKAFLGEDAYQLLERQEDSQTERSRLKDYQKKFESAGQPLSSEQENQLLLAMYDERRQFPFQYDYNDASKFDYEHLHFTEEKFNVFFQEMEQLNEKILARARDILTAEQLDRFRGLQQEQLEKSRMTIKMTQALFPTKGARR